MEILVTGFAPFGGETVNPSWEAVFALPEEVGGARVHKLEVPTAYGAAAETVWGEIERLRPDAVLCVGQAGGSAAVRVERIAVNLRDARIPDNAGVQPCDVPIEADGPCAYFATLPTRRITETVQSGGIPAELSYSAGTFVCNDLLYSVLHLSALHRPEMRCGFIHLPYLPRQAVGKAAGMPSMCLDDMIAALRLAIETIGAEQ